MIRHKRVQHPIGQGFFHTASVDFNGLVIRYVYDCGSNNSDELSERIKAYREETASADILFISHFDNDHVSGLDLLLGEVGCDVVVLPYHSSYERVLLAIGGSVDGNLSGSYVEFLSDPVGWLGSRGVKVVVFVGNDDTDLGDPEFPDPPRKDLPDDWHPREWRLRIGEEAITVRAAPNGPAVWRINHSDPLIVNLDGVDQNWCFLTFVHPERERADVFKRSVQTEFPGVFDAPPSILGTVMTLPLRDILRDDTQRDKLANCYATIASDRNYTSMSLYSGPFSELRWFSAEKVTQRGKPREGSCREVGWLGTGDSQLKVPRRRAHFLRHYNRLLPLVRTIALPHHGADRNFDRAIVPQQAERCIVSARSKNVHHPGSNVRSTLAELEKQLLQTTEAVETLVSEAFEIRRLG